MTRTFLMVGLPPGQHKVLIELVDAAHHVFTGCQDCRHTATFTVPGTVSHAR
jgi:Family of unknown function (DUF6130)